MWDLLLSTTHINAHTVISFTCRLSESDKFSFSASEHVEYNWMSPTLACLVGHFLCMICICLYVRIPRMYLCICSKCPTIAAYYVHVRIQVQNSCHPLKNTNLNLGQRSRGRLFEEIRYYYSIHYYEVLCD